MLPFNYHIHSSFSDGSSPVWQMVNHAVKQGIRYLAVADHSPLPFENEWSINQSDKNDYIKTIDQLREKYTQLELFRTLELDFIPGVTESFEKLKELWKLDYTLGSVHLVKHPEKEKLWFIDGPQQNYEQGLEKIFDMDIKTGVTSYFNQVNEMIRTQQPDVIGHIDKIKMNNKRQYFSENEGWYQSMMEKALEIAAEYNCIIEINTRSYYKGKTKDLFPSDAALETIRDREIPVTINTDAHHPNELTEGHKEAVKRLKLMGFKTIKYLNGSGWDDYDL